MKKLFLLFDRYKKNDINEIAGLINENLYVQHIIKQNKNQDKLCLLCQKR